MGEEVKGLYEEYNGWAIWHSGGGIWLAVKDVLTKSGKPAVFILGHSGVATARRLREYEFATREDYFSDDYDELVNPDEISVASYDRTRDEYVVTEKGKEIFGEDTVLRHILEGIQTLDECLETVFGIPREKAVKGALVKLQQRFGN